MLQHVQPNKKYDDVPMSSKPSYHYDIPYHKWNMAAAFNERVNNLIIAKNEAFIEGDVYKMYSTIRCVYRDISFVFTDKDIARLEKYFEKVRQTLKPQHQATKSLTAMSQRFMLSKAQRLLEEIDLVLTGVMNENEMILPNFKAKTGLKKIEERYGVKIDDEETTDE